MALAFPESCRTPQQPLGDDNGFHRTDDREPRERRAHHVPADAADTAGGLEFELELSADGRVPGAHVHPSQEERFHVLEGTMTFRLGMKKITAEAGETVVVPAGRVHKFTNGGDGVARARVEVVRRSTWRTC